MKKSKGFTLTELAIVIAVIAILIAVLVPTFISLINKANESNDVVTVRNMNTVLSTEVDDIDKPTDALQIVYEEGGYSVANMTPKSTGKIVYDELTASFVFVYSDGTTYPEDTTTNLTAYTTWELVSTSDIEPDADGAYHFEKSDYANNSIILKGSDWAGKTVYASYGVELWNDSDTTTTLNGLYIENTDKTAQTAEAGSISLAKTAIKTAGVADSTRNIIVNVKTNYLSYAAEVYNISDHSTVNTLLSTSGSGTYYQYGTTTAYDITKSGSSNVVVCNEKQAQKINNKEVAVIKTSDTQTSTVITDNTDTITIDMDSDDNVRTIVVETTETLQITLTEETITIKITNYDEVTATESISQEIVISATTSSTTSDTTSYTSLVSFQEEATTSGTGTEKYPYYVSSYADLVEKVKSDCYIQLVANISLSGVLTVNAGITINLDMAGYSITQSTANVTITNKGNLTITNSTKNREKSIITGKNSKNVISNQSNGVITLEYITIKAGTNNNYYALSLTSGETTVDNCILYTGASGGYLVNVAKANPLTIINSAVATGTDASKNNRIKLAAEGSICIADNSVAADADSASTTQMVLYTSSGCIDEEKIDENTISYKRVTSYAAYVGTTGYATVQKALSTAASNGGGAGNTVTLNRACSYSSSTNNELTSGKELIVDLSGYILTLSDEITISDGTSITFKNGTITKSTSNAFIVEAGSSLILDDVDLTTSGYGIYVRGEGASVTVTNGSTITAGTYAVSTNAATSDYYNVAVTIENSTLYANCGILFNVPGSLSISGSTVTGGLQAVIVRAGTATISDTTLKSECADSWTLYDSKNWSSGNAVAVAVLVIGNRNGNYADDAQVTIKNVTFEYDTSVDGAKAVYMYGGVVYNTTGSTDPNKAILCYDSSFDTQLVTIGSDEQYIVMQQSAD